jgi:putative heme-binding domain-containing protein
MRLLFLCAAVVLSLGAQHQQEGEKSRHPFIGDAKAIAAGRSLFVSGCAACHGAEGQGGRGPSLRERVMWHPLEDDVLFNTIQKGIPAGGMPGSNLTEEKGWQLVAFVRSLTAPAIENNVPGDPQAGEAVFWSKAAGCGGCHRIRGRGGFAGPDLSNVGSTRAFPDIQDAIAVPDSVITPGYQSITLMLKNGSKLQGVSRNRSNYSVQVQDAKGSLHMVPMSDVSEIVLSKSSLMPKDYAKRLSQTDFQNLLAFLGRQSVRPPAMAKK